MKNDKNIQINLVPRSHFGGFEERTKFRSKKMGGGREEEEETFQISFSPKKRRSYKNIRV